MPVCTVYESQTCWILAAALVTRRAVTLLPSYNNIDIAFFDIESRCLDMPPLLHIKTNIALNVAALAVAISISINTPEVPQRRQFLPDYCRQSLQSSNSTSDLGSYTHISYIDSNMVTALCV